MTRTNVEKIPEVFQQMSEKLDPIVGTIIDTLSFIPLKVIEINELLLDVPL